VNVVKCTQDKEVGALRLDAKNIYAYINRKKNQVGEHNVEKGPQIKLRTTEGLTKTAGHMG
jgi:hypothetical protein